MAPCTMVRGIRLGCGSKTGRGLAFSFRSSMKTGRMHEKNVARRGYCHEFVFCGHARAVNVNNMKIPASGTGKPMTSGKRTELRLLWRILLSHVLYWANLQH